MIYRSTNIFKDARRLLACVGIMFALHGCFTGVESTPKISYSDVKKENITISPEQKFLSDVAPQPPRDWKAGKKFFVSDDKINIMFLPPANGVTESLTGKEITFHEMRPFVNVTGNEITEIEFISPSGKSLVYRDNTPWGNLNEKTQLEVPFTIETSIVDSVYSQIIGKTLYANTPLWYTPDGSMAVNGLRYVELEVTDVKPGNEFYPLSVVFRPTDSERQFSMFMTIGNKPTSTRNFSTLFSFENPRVKYSYISDEIWRLIVHSRVRKGMTREECRLALGAPTTIGQRPAQGGMVEYWQYSDGIFLLFEDGGYLDYFRR
ncbi:MAG: hypothetical protein NC102_05105 [Clostridium sp.]|nr:hypothetical protein [Clostridium sp.]